MIRADEEPVDPKKLLEDASKAKCARAWRAYEVTKYERPAFQESSDHYLQSNEFGTHNYLCA